MRVAILGGGMAGLAAAWRLSDPDNPPADVTVYQRGWRLGGKGASSRGAHGRIEEHGLHVWLGYYENAFRLLRAAYAELDRPRTDPTCPIPTWRDAFTPASAIGLGEDAPDGWQEWVAHFPENDLVPGEAPYGDDGMDGFAFVQHCLALIARFGASLAPVDAPVPRAVLSSGPTPPPRRSAVADLAGGIGTGVREVAIGGLAAERTARFLEVLTTMVRGIVADRLLVRGFAAVDHLDLRDWLRLHGASDAAIESAFVQGAYDLAFAYEDGRRDRPRFAAGTSLVLTGRMFFAYRGAMFWKMRAGMGDVVFAPIYQALRQRGVRVELFHRLDELVPDDAGTHIARVHLGRQVALRDGALGYDPLVRIGGLPVFPDHVDLAQVEGPPALERQPLEEHGCTWPDAEAVVLESGRDFDAVVLAVSLGMLPHVAPRLIARSERWQRMVAEVRTVATQAVQVWLGPDERSLGWHQPAATVTGCGAPLDTFASMSETLPFEAWEQEGAPAAAASFCAVLEESVAADAAPVQRVREHAASFLDERAGNLWPASTAPGGGFRWDLLVGGPDGATGSDALAGQHVRANVDPSDRYVQSAPGSIVHRLRADGSGYNNLVLAGDWIDTGLNAGCIEAATLGGLQAANALLGRPLHDQTTGFRPARGDDG